MTEPTSLPVISTWDLFPDLERRPRLLLGIDPEWLARGVRPSPSRTWHHLRHQAGGIHCDQVELLATELVLRPERETGLLELADRFGDTNLSGWGITIDDLVRYRDALRGLLGVDCALSYREFREAVYPIDVTPEHLRHLAVDELPRRLDDLLEVDERFTLALGMLNRWRLWVISENSD
ncbi:hypothetical protein QOL99_02675 [Deinococcus sp. MIMF12]|uniref:Uncharacterized protein n=1 Tax=Deinococcus rhizophilus TaxID=3049544 RepID=A0ABT7JDB3_9DEIO|nr:hypothetical protein [Deinococcus rhizophilus]MDL2343048.1 hypothetical protein [Deinococcus rhizophilus]